MQKDAQSNMGAGLDGIDYVLPEEKIAHYPLEIRHNSKLLVYREGKITDGIFRNIADFLPSQTLLVFNNTRVVRARMHFNKASGSPIEIFCLEPYEPADYERAFAATGSGKWMCMVGNLKKWKNEILEKSFEINGKAIFLRAKKLGNGRDYQIVEFIWMNEEISFSEILEHIGETPIPPYLKRETERIDIERYQTIYAKKDGSVAAPTAGLHFSPDVLQEVKSNGAEIIELTLHVGAGTFRPITANNVAEHLMHAEHFSISRDALSKLLSFHGSIIAVGTTSVRTLESLYYCGVKLASKDKINDSVIHIEQWKWKEINEKISMKESLTAILDYIDKAGLEVFQASTQIMIIPGYEFRFIDGLITNFHQPRSSLLLLVSALAGDDWKKIYEHALSSDYRFLSYGDSSLLMKNGQI